jgi:peptide/nickel transport system substrate-binding protein
MTLRKPALAMAAITSLALAGCASNSPSTAGGGEGAQTQTLTLGILGEPRSWDPSQAHVGHVLQPYQVTYDSLLLREPDGALSPMLATEWEYNEDNTVLTLDLRTDVTFSDGAKFDADAAKANFDHFREANGPQMNQLRAVESVAAVDEDTVELTLSAPDPSLEFYLSQAAGLMGSPTALGTEGITTDPVGSGPYVMDKASSVPGSQLVFKAREDYWNKDLQKFSTVTLKTLADITARTNALVSGQVDATILDPKAGKQAEGSGMILESNQVDWTGLLLMDRGGEVVEPLADVRVRQAINYAFDRQTILDQVRLGRGSVTSQMFGPDSGAWVEDLEDRYTYDPEKAKELLAEAGYSSGVTIEVPALPAEEPTLLAVLKQQLSDVGITLNVGAPTTTTFTSDVAAKKYPVIQYNLFQGEPWVAINQLISTQALYNPFKTTTPELQALIDDVQTGGTEAAEKAQAVNEYVTENAWFAPLFRIDQMYYHSPKITVTPQVQQAVPSIYNYAPAK